MRISRIIAAVITLFAMLVSLAAVTSASEVVYDDHVFEINISNKGDLFENFKGCMPGDTLTQEINVKNDAKNIVTIDMYLRSSGATEQTKALLSQMTLCVYQLGSSILYNGPADKATGIDDWVYLGKIYPGADVTLEVILEIPITVGDEFQNAIGDVVWEFKTEEYAIDTGIRECPICGHEMENIPVTDPVTGEEYVIHHCPQCGHEEDMLCPICGSRMKRVIVREADGHYYIYYVCVHDDTHHTDPSPQTGDSTGTVTWICITAVSLLGVIFCIFAYKKRRREQED